MPVDLYIGRSLTQEADELYLPLDLNDANHILILGKSGFGKTTFMRAFAEEIFEKIPAKLLLIFEFKQDKSKAFGLFNTVPYLQDVQEYLRIWKENKALGKLGDFAFGVPNYILANVKQFEDSRVSVLSWHGLKPKAFPFRRFVFNPRRGIEDILIDNTLGKKEIGEVVDAKLPYDALDFFDVASITYVSEDSLYGMRIRNIWDFEEIRDPDELIQYGYNMEVEAGRNPDKDPSGTFLRIKETANVLKNNPILDYTDDFREQFSVDHVNVIDFSPNSGINYKTKAFIFKKIVDYLVEEFSVNHDVPVFVFLDEVQNLMAYKAGREGLSKLFREGRSLWINVVVATQYLKGILNGDLMEGASHVFVVGQLASFDDYQKIKKYTRDAFKLMKAEKTIFMNRAGEKELRRPKTIREYNQLRSKLKGSGFVIYEKKVVEKVSFRPPQSL